jgi:hypothetical protein
MLALWFSDDQEIFYLLNGTRSTTAEEFKSLMVDAILYLGTLS